MKLPFNKKTARVASVLCATLIGASSMLMFSGCTTAHPTVRIDIEFNSESYELDYTLYRKMYPATVQHFIELAENGYYDGLCVHNYTSAFFYTGVYNYNENATGNGYGGLEYKDYYNTVKAYDSFTQTVFDTTTGEGTYTLYGEFSNNAFSVEKNGLKNKMGALAMYYNDMSFCKTRVNATRSSDGELSKNLLYSNNCATSEFYIFNGTSNSTYDRKYCVFGELKDTDKLKDLSDAIAEYVNEQKKGNEDYEFTTTYDKVWVDVDDAYAEKHSESYDVPKTPIIIKSVKVTKY